MSSKVVYKCDMCGTEFVQILNSKEDAKLNLTNLDMTNWFDDDYEQLSFEVCEKCEPIVRNEFEIMLFRVGILK